MTKQPATELFTSGSDDDALGQFCASLQPLPSVLSYYDEFDDATRSTRSPTEVDVFELFFHGRRMKVDFAKRNPQCALIFKHTLALMFEQGLSVATVASYFSNSHHLTDQDLIALLRASPIEIGRLWG